MLHIKLKGITKCSNMVANIMPTDPLPLDPRDQSSTFSEHGHVAYQIKGITKFSNMVANFLPADPPPPPPTPLLGPIGQISAFSEHGPVAYQIKGNHETHQLGSKYFARNPAPPPTTLGDGVNRSKLNFFRTWSFFITN